MCRAVSILRVEKKVLTMRKGDINPRRAQNVVNYILSKYRILPKLICDEQVYLSYHSALYLVQLQFQNKGQQGSFSKKKGAMVDNKKERNPQLTEMKCTCRTDCVMVACEKGMDSS